MSDYEALKIAGHSPAKAAEILLDAKRGDAYAAKWIAVCRQNRDLDKQARINMDANDIILTIPPDYYKTLQEFHEPILKQPTHQKQKGGPPHMNKAEWRKAIKRKQ